MRLFSRECGFDDTNAVRIEFALETVMPGVGGSLKLTGLTDVKLRKLASHV
jgi:hypothetical protein